MLKAITLYDPWGSLMAIDAKRNETRPNRTAHRGDIAIHVAKTDVGCSDVVTHAAVRALESRNIKPEEIWPYSFGCIVAVVDIWDVQPSEMFIREKQQPVPNPVDTSQIITVSKFALTEEEYTFGNYAPGRWIYRTRNLRRLKTPVPCRGFQCVGWTVPDAVEALVQAQLAPRCSFGVATAAPCQNQPTHASTFNGERTTMCWCAEHAAQLQEGPQTAGHGFVKL